MGHVLKAYMDATISAAAHPAFATLGRPYPPLSGLFPLFTAQTSDLGKATPIDVRSAQIPAEPRAAFTVLIPKNEGSFSDDDDNINDDDELTPSKDVSPLLSMELTIYRMPSKRSTMEERQDKIIADPLAYYTKFMGERKTEVRFRWGGSATGGWEMVVLLDIRHTVSRTTSNSPICITDGCVLLFLFMVTLSVLDD